MADVLEAPDGGLGWDIIPTPSTQQVVPARDLVEHRVEEDGACHCEPRVSIVNGWGIVVHNAADGREARERA